MYWAVANSQTQTKRVSDAVITAFIGYFIAASITLLSVRHPDAYPTMWLADAVILTLLLVNPKSFWPAILISGFTANSLTTAVTLGWTPAFTISGAIGMGQTGLAAFLLKNADKPKGWLSKIPTYLQFVLTAGVIAPGIAGLISSLLNVIVNGDTPLYGFVRWYFGNALGFLIFTPFLLGVFDGSFVNAFKQQSRGRKTEVIALYCAHIVITYAAFAQNIMPLLFIPVSAVVLLSFRLGRHGSIIGVMIVTIIGAAMTVSGRGPIMFTQGSAEIQEYFFQVYLVILLATTLPVATAVTLKSRVLENLAEREAALRLLLSHRSDVILGFDGNGRCHWIEGPVQDYLGIAPHEMIGRPLDVVHVQTSKVIEEMILCKEGRDIRPAAFEFIPVLRPETLLEASLSIRWHRGAPIGSIITLRDATRYRIREAKVLAHVETDHLTGFINRASFRSHLSIATRDVSRQSTLAIIDVDRFTSIQTVHGHTVANEVLLEVANHIQQATRSDDVTARLGNNEFALLLRCDLVTAQTICQQIVDSVREAPIYRDSSVSIIGSISCGLAEHRPGMSREDLIDAAETALYEVRHSGSSGIRTAA